MSIRLATKELVTQESVITEVAPAAPVINSFVVNGTDDLALDPAGGQTVVIKGKGFRPGLTVIAAGSTIGAVTLVDSTTITFTSEAQSSGTYNLFVINQDGGTAILSPGLIYSGLPTFTTEAGSLGSYYETTEIDEVVVAEEDADTITYSVVSGSLPSGATLNTAGYITGTSPVEESSTTYTFTVEAVDEENQSTTREFSLTINVDVVTWVTPSEGTILLDGDEEMTNVTLLATSAAGYNIDSYTANTLPAGVLLSGNTVYGTPNTEETVVTTFTATSNTTNRTATRTVTWVVAIGDAFFNQTTLLLNADNNTFITDASDNAFTITPAGDTRPSAFSPYNTGWSNYFDGTGDYLTAPSNAAFGFGTGDFTVEGWWYFTGTISTYQRPWGFSDDNDNIELNGSVLRVGGGSQGTLITGSTTILPNTWYHIALVRSSGTYKLYLNGTQEGGSASNSYNSSSRQFGIMAYTNGANPSTGYVSNARVIKGTALYTSNFTPPTTPLTAVSGTSLLTCQSNRLIDNSTNAFTITKNGDVKVTSFAPFTETDTTTGSGYFDGTGDEVQITQPQTTFFTALGDWTVEAWVYPTSFAGAQYSKPIIASAADRFVIRASVTSGTTSSLNLYIQKDGGGLIGGNSSGTGGGTIRLNEWSHVAVVRYNGVFKVYLNGTAVITINAPSDSLLFGDSFMTIGGAEAGSNPFWTGYISNARMVKDVAVYTEDFDPPTSPLTAVSGTQLLTLQNRIGYNNHQFNDKSIVNNTITRSGNASAGSFSPYVPTGWSAYFNATGVESYLSYNVPVSFTTTSTETIEFNIYLEDLGKRGASSSDSAFTCFSFGSFTTVLTCTIGTNGGIGYYFRSNQTFSVVGGPAGTISPGQWYSVKMENANGSLNLYVDGTLVAGPVALFGNMSWSDVQIGRFIYESGSIFNGWSKGYIRNFKITKNDVVLLHALTGNNFSDSGPYRYTPTPVTTNGPIKIVPFSNNKPSTITPDSYSVYFDGSGDYLSTPQNSDFNLGTGAFSVEGWFYVNAFSTSNRIIGIGLGTAGGASKRYTGWTAGYNSSFINFYRYDGSEINRSASVALTTGQWYHYVACRDTSSNFALFLNGTRVLSQANATTAYNNVNSDALDIAKIEDSDPPTAKYANAYFSNIRVIAGTTAYDPTSSTITVPTSPLTAISGTSLLTCQSPTVIDNSTNDFAITVLGNSQPSKFNPFGETVTEGVEYSPGSHGGSVYFDGNDYIQVPAGQAWNFGSGPFTMEMWIYPDPAEDNSYNLFSINQSGSNQWAWAVTTYLSWGMYFYWGNYGSNQSERYTGVYPIKGQWNHVAVCRDASYTWRFFINGVLYPTSVFQQGTSWSDSRALNNTAINPRVGEGFTGYATDIRITKGVSLYSSNFVLPISPNTPTPADVLFVSADTSAIQDKTGRNVLETVGNTRTLPESPYRLNKSVYFDGNGDGLSIASNSVLSCSGNIDFCIEAWVYRSVNGVSQVIVNKSGISGTSYSNYNLRIGSGNNIVLDIGNSGSPGSSVATLFNSSSSNLILAGQWSHVVATKKYVGGAPVNEYRLFVNGKLDYYATAGNPSDTRNDALTIGYEPAAVNQMTGYISNIRIIKNSIPSDYQTASTTINAQIFTPPTSPLTAVSGTSLLTCNTYNFTDSSTNNFTITRNGDARISSRGPFTETQTENNAMFFDGNGDYLLIPTSTNNEFGTGDFTIEFWIYPNTTVGSGGDVIFDRRSSATTRGRVISLENDGKIYFYGGDTNTSAFEINISTSVLTASQWYHYALTKSGSTYTCYLNGVSQNSATSSATLADDTSPTRIGAGVNNANYLDGYIDDLRITKGVARTITVPTSAFKTK